MKLKTINIHGKNYVEVNERIKYFRENYKGWSLISELIDLTENRCVIKASITDEKDKVIATGIAYEVMGSSYINKTSFIENCETSAWGRALGNLGIGIDTSIASAFEVNNAIIQQETKPKTKEKLNDSKYQAMIVALGNGKVDVVKERMNNYKLTKKQKENLNKLIKENIKEINEAGKSEIKEKKLAVINETIEGLGNTILDYHQDDIMDNSFLNNNINK
tara:strand:- start:1156 stop:1815 length:660 start_codon:yes stop_codon:yes gene_type:complete